MAAKFQRQKIGIFDDDELDKKVWPNDCDNDRLPDIARSAPKTSILSFPVVGRCRNRSGVSFFGSAWSKTPDFPFELLSYICHNSRAISISGLDGHIAMIFCKIWSRITVILT